MPAKLLITRFISPRYNETEPNGPLYYTQGQVVHLGANDIQPGTHWANGAQGRVVTLLEKTPEEAEVWVESEYADSVDYAEWEISEDPDNPILTRKRKWVVDILDLESWFETQLGRALADHEGVTVGYGEQAEWDNRLTELPKTRWTKAEWEAANP